MQSPTSPLKKLKSPNIENVNCKTSVTCSNVPESLFEAAAARKHFSKFGKVQKIRLVPKRHICIVEYEQPLSAERAVLNAGAYDGFMFDVTRTKLRVRRRSRKEDDPDWLPDSDVEEELSVMSGAPTYRLTRQKVMDVDSQVPNLNTIKRIIKQSPLRKKNVLASASATVPQQSGIESPVLVAVTQTSLTTAEAATELNQLRTKISSTPDEQWRILDARDKILRSWGGSGARVKVGGAIIGTCPDMCPEKERLHRQAEHQVMTLETVPDCDFQLETRRAVKQYSRSSADQEIPMCYELRSPKVLLNTCAYLLHEVADTKRQVTLADWFHFMWDRLRGIRKDITQQALCCADSINLVEMCARFHAHCAARLADLEHTQFDQKLNTDNLTKCLQTLKHMYADVGKEMKPNEAEFRGYIALLNLGDANFWWEIKQLPIDMQKSNPIVFSIKIFNALDNNNYVRFFRLIKEKATYLEACILLRYFNDVRARALARIVKAYAPRGGSRYPTQDIMNALHFETVENMKAFISHYGLRFSKIDDTELSVILDRNDFIEDSDPYPLSRAINLIESKRQCTVGEIIAGGRLPDHKFRDHIVYSSFSPDGTLKETALVAEDQGYNTFNDTNRDVKELKLELRKLTQGVKNYNMVRTTVVKNDFEKPFSSPRKDVKSSNTEASMLFSFKPAIPIASVEVIKDSPEKVESKTIYSFSKPHETVETNLVNIHNISGNKESETRPSIFSKPTHIKENGSDFVNKNVFGTNSNKNLFNSTGGSGNLNSFGGKNIFAIANKNIESKLTNNAEVLKRSTNIFGNFNKNNSAVEVSSENIFAKANAAKSIFSSGNSANNNLSPGALFKGANEANGSDATYSIFQSKNKVPSVASQLFQSVNSAQKVYEFDSQDDDSQKHLEMQRLNEVRLKQEQSKKEEELLREKKLKEESQRLEEERRREEQKKQELKKLEEKKQKDEEKKQEELRRKIKEEEEKAAELKRKAEKEKRVRIENESKDLTEDIVNEINNESVEEIMREEFSRFENLIAQAKELTEELISVECYDICYSETKSQKIWADKLMKKFFYLWRKNFMRNVQRRNLLEDVPVWLPHSTPIEIANRYRRRAENAALTNMNLIHRGFRFKGEMKQFPIPDTYNLMEIIKTPLLKRMRTIHYPYDKCFFWKVTLVLPGTNTWLYRKIDIQKWLLNVFSDRKEHEVSETLIHVSKQSWNNLMDFAISVSMTNSDATCSEAIEGTYGMMFYLTDNDLNAVSKSIKNTIKHKYPYQTIPIAIILPQTINDCDIDAFQGMLIENVKSNVILAFKLYIVSEGSPHSSLNTVTKTALKWLAKNCPPNPSLETDYLKSLCERYLGNELWQRLRLEDDGRIDIVLKDFQKLIHCYNTSVDKLTQVITNEDLFNYPSFPLEFKQYLNLFSPYPKPYEFIPSNIKNSANVSTVRSLMEQLKLPYPTSRFNPMNAIGMQEQIREYCNQICCFDNSEEVVCKVVAVLPNELSDVKMPSEQFHIHFRNFDLVYFLNILVYEKISKLNFLENFQVIYERSVLDDYKNMNWLYDSDILATLKHKAIECEDDVDYFIDNKRRRLEPVEYLTLENKDCTIVEESIKISDVSISKYSDCQNAVKQLEEKIEEERQKSIQLENLLRAALSA